jgi:hypothetical protein
MKHIQVTILVLMYLTTMLFSQNTWIKLPLDSAIWLEDIVYSNNQFVAVGGILKSEEGKGIILTSPDGITWTNRMSGTTKF